MKIRLVSQEMLENSGKMFLIHSVVLKIVAVNLVVKLAAGTVSA